MAANLLETQATRAGCGDNKQPYWHFKIVKSRGYYQAHNLYWHTCVFVHTNRDGWRSSYTIILLFNSVLCLFYLNNIIKYKNIMYQHKNTHLFLWFSYIYHKDFSTSLLLIDYYELSFFDCWMLKSHILKEFLSKK